MKRRLCYLFISLVLAFGATTVCASKEGILRMATFELSSEGIGDSGPVVVSGIQGDNGIQELAIRAFGKQFKLNGQQLIQVQGISINGLQLSYETGYKELGGRTIYIVLSKGFTSGIIGRRFVVITESGTIRISNELK